MTRVMAPPRWRTIAVARLRKVRALTRALLADPALPLTAHGDDLFAPFLADIASEADRSCDGSEYGFRRPPTATLRILDTAIGEAILGREDAVSRNCRALGAQLGLSEPAVQLLVLCLDVHRNPLQTALAFADCDYSLVTRHFGWMAAPLGISPETLRSCLAELDAHELREPSDLAMIHARSLTQKQRRACSVQLALECTLDPIIRNQLRRVRTDSPSHKAIPRLDRLLQRTSV